MIIPDINLLLYAEIDAFPQHGAARRWWEEALSGDRVVALPSVSLFGFVRIGTNRRVFATPMSADDALGRVESWLALPTTTFLLPGPRHLEIAFALLRQIGTAANLTTDAQLAALAIEHNAELCSSDHDFGRFGGLRWSNPLTG